MPLYCASSTRFGSMRISFTSVGVALIRNEPMIALTQTLLPEPVAPAMSRCGIFDRSALEGCPATSWPRAKASFERLATSPWVRLASTSFRVTRSNAEFGISTPTYGSPGIGASIRMLRAASASARLSDRPSIRLSLMPGSTSSAYWVTTGPSWIRATFTPMPKCASVSRMRWPLAVRSICAALDSGASARRSSVGSSQTRSIGSSAASDVSCSPTVARCASSVCSSSSSPSSASAGRSSATTGIGVGRGGPFAPGAGRSRRTMTGGSSSSSGCVLSRSRTRSRSPARAAAGAASSVPSAVRSRRPATAARRAASSASSRRASRPAR